MLWNCEFSCFCHGGTYSKKLKLSKNLEREFEKSNINPIQSNWYSGLSKVNKSFQLLHLSMDFHLFTNFFFSQISKNPKRILKKKGNSWLIWSDFGCVKESCKFHRFHHHGFDLHLKAKNIQISRNINVIQKEIQTQMERNE